MAGPLDPALIDRMRLAVRPDWTHTVVARRTLAGTLVAIATVIALRPGPAETLTTVLVTAHDIDAGTVLTADDIVTDARPAATVPHGASSDLAATIGSLLTGPARRGEILTDVRLLGRQLAEAAAGPDARLVSVRPSDTALIGVVRPGDVVDVIAAPQTDPPSPPRILAAGGVVVLTSNRDSTAADDRAVLVALPAFAATAVAAATLVEPVTLTLR